MGPPLDDRLAVEILRGNGLVGANDVVTVTPLSGGVSSTVLLAEAGARRMVLKQPRARFAVQDEWVVDDRRVFSEYRFLRTFQRRLPEGRILRPVTFVPQLRTLVMEAAPAGWKSWKDRLLSGTVETSLAQEAGRLLASIHGAGEAPELAGRFHNAGLFEEQRSGPYFRTTAQRLPGVGPLLESLLQEFRSRQDLVHGDFSPKNLLTDGQRLVLIDHEVVTRGDAAFDVAFLLSHLMLKSIHMPTRRAELAAAATSFVNTYTGEREPPPDFVPRAWAYVGALLLARVLGKSPVEYLTNDERRRALQWGQELLRRPTGLEEPDSPPPA